MSTNTARRISGISAVLTAGAVGAMFAAPSATAAPSDHASFSGSCSIIGTDTASNSHSYFRGHGICFGSLNGKRATAHHVVEIVRETGVISPDYFGAPVVHGASNGSGVLIFGSSFAHAAHGPVLHFQIQSSLSSFTVEGATGGMGSGQAVPTTNGELRLTSSTSGAMVG